MRALLILTALAGCVGSMAPVVSGFNGSSVNVQEPGLSASSPPSAEAAQSATATCGGKASYASARMVTDSTVEYLFICR